MYDSSRVMLRLMLELHLPKESNLEEWAETYTCLEWGKECPYGCLDRQPIASYGRKNGYCWICE